MTGRSSKTKGANAEREVAKILAAAGLTEATRQPYSGASPDWPGDVRLDGFAVEVKRQEKWDVPAYIRQAHAAARGDRVPIVILRRNKAGVDPCGEWHVIEPLESWAYREVQMREPY